MSLPFHQLSMILSKLFSIWSSTLQCRFVVGNTPFSVPANVGVTELSSLINKLLNEGENCLQDKSIKFTRIFCDSSIGHSLHRSLLSALF